MLYNTENFNNSGIAILNECYIILRMLIIVALQFGCQIVVNSSLFLIMLLLHLYLSFELHIYVKGITVDMIYYNGSNVREPKLRIEQL